MCFPALAILPLFRNWIFWTLETLGILGLRHAIQGFAYRSMTQACTGCVLQRSSNGMITFVVLKEKIISQNKKRRKCFKIMELSCQSFWRISICEFTLHILCQ